MLYPNRLQACLLFDRPVQGIDPIIRDFVRIEQLKSSATFRVSEERPRRFFRLFDGAEELTLTAELIDGPAKADAFRGALASTFTGIATPDIRARLDRTQSHLLIEVSHGMMGADDGESRYAATFTAMGSAAAGATQAQFERRLQVLALMARVAIEHAMPLAVHWTQSDLLVAGELFDKFAASSKMPGPLHIHPFLFGPRPAPGDDALIGIRTFGARHWLGREILVEPSVLPWALNFETILAFLRIALAPNGYVIPDGDTFGPEDRSLSYRVVHHDKGALVGTSDPEPADMAMYELLPMKHLAHGFLAPDHVPKANVVESLAFPPALMPAGQDERMALANEWADKRKLAEGIGGRFEVRHPAAPPEPPQAPAPPVPQPSLPGAVTVSGRGLRARVFGRKGL